jgi:hypothetical protein
VFSPPDTLEIRLQIDLTGSDVPIRPLSLMQLQRIELIRSKFLSSDALRGTIVSGSNTRLSLF